MRRILASFYYYLHEHFYAPASGADGDVFDEQGEQLTILIVW